MTTNEMLFFTGSTWEQVKWLRRSGQLRLAPRGKSGAGKGNSMDWNPEAVAEVLIRRVEQSFVSR